MSPEVTVSWISSHDQSILHRQHFSEAEGLAPRSARTCDYAGLLPPRIWQKSSAQEDTCKMLALQLCLSLVPSLVQQWSPGLIAPDLQLTAAFVFSLEQPITTTCNPASSFPLEPSANPPSLFMPVPQPQYFTCYVSESHEELEK